MGGKSYFCDYCSCYMKNDINVRKTHNDGLAHKIKKVSYMREYEDPRKVYDEEICKQPCSRYFKSFCKFDLFCQFTHFNENQLKELKEIVDNLNQKEYHQPSTKKSKKNLKSMILQTILPGCNKIAKKKLKQLPKKLPPSLRPLNMKKISKVDFKSNTWG